MPEYALPSPLPSQRSTAAACARLSREARPGRPPQKSNAPAPAAGLADSAALTDCGVAEEPARRRGRPCPRRAGSADAAGEFAAGRIRRSRWRAARRPLPLGASPPEGAHNLRRRGRIRSAALVTSPPLPASRTPCPLVRNSFPLILRRRSHQLVRRTHRLGLHVCPRREQHPHRLHAPGVRSVMQRGPALRRATGSVAPARGVEEGRSSGLKKSFLSCL